MKDKQHADGFFQFVAADSPPSTGNLLFQAAVVEQLGNLNENLNENLDRIFREMQQARLDGSVSFPVK